MKSMQLQKIGKSAGEATSSKENEFFKRSNSTEEHMITQGT